MAELAGPPRRDVVLIGGSQGSVSALRRLLAALPQDLPAAIAITVHRSPSFVSSLAQVFDGPSRLPVREPRDGQLLEPGRVFLAPRDRHLVFRGGAMWLDHGPRHQHARPSIDVMFRSGAAAYGPRVVGVLLTGNLSDGVAGLIAIKRRGGLSVVQDPDEAEAPSMPANAIVHDHVDAVFQLTRAARLLAELVAGASIDDATRSAGALRLPKSEHAGQRSA